MFYSTAAIAILVRNNFTRSYILIFKNLVFILTAAWKAAFFVQ